MKNGFVALVGAGPGEAGLLTIRGKELLEKSDVVVYDRLVSDDILRLIPHQAKKINVGKQSSNHLVPQHKINEILLYEALNGNTVVRLKGGDPFVFGRGGEELELIVKHQIPFEVVPGITSAIAVPSFAGIPVTHRDFCSSLHIITGHQKENESLEIDFDALEKAKGTLIFLMGVASLKEIADGLIAAGADKNTLAAIIENGTAPTQRKIVSTIDQIYSEAIKQQIKSPAVIVVGDVCSLSERYDWFSKRPLFGSTIIVTRPADSEGTLSNRLKELGAEVFDFPCIRIEVLQDKERLYEAIKNIRQYSWLTFTSKNGVQIFFEVLKNKNLDCRILGHIKIAAIGLQTANELLKYGIITDYVPEIFDGRHLGKDLAERTTDKDNILLIRAENGSEDILTELDSYDRKYDNVSVYKTSSVVEHVKEIEEILIHKDKVYVTFTSASTVEGFMNNMGNKDLSKITGICIGEQTAKKADEYKIDYVVSDIAAIDSMIKKLLEVTKECN